MGNPCIELPYVGLDEDGMGVCGWAQRRYLDEMLGEHVVQTLPWDRKVRRDQMS